MYYEIIYIISLFSLYIKLLCDMLDWLINNNNNSTKKNTHKR